MVKKDDMAGSANVWLDMMEHVHGRLPLKLKQEIVQHFCNYNNFDRLG